MEAYKEEKMYFDESIIALRNQAKRMKKQDIYKTCTIQGEEITFARRSFYDDKIRMMVPESFAEMDGEIAISKYPSVERPEIILTSPENDCDLTFSLLEETAAEEELLPLVEILKNSIQAAQPANEIYEINEIRSETDKAIAYVTFKSYAIGGALYNQMFSAIIDQRILLCNFHCAEEVQEEWEDLAQQMMKTIEDSSKERSRLQ